MYVFFKAAYYKEDLSLFCLHFVFSLTGFPRFRLSPSFQGNTGKSCVPLKRLCRLFNPGWLFL